MESNKVEHVRSSNRIDTCIDLKVGLTRFLALGREGDTS